MVEKPVNAFYEVLARKYSLFALPKCQVPKLQRGKVAFYREQETAETKTFHFLVESDLTGKGSPFGSRRTEASPLVLLRHCGPGSIVRYAVN
ncbi:hypothetical protein HPB48_020403 [Haemaphysalis longicornis]|uniref:SKA complex subunit 1 n=1 Tax=Haemaphysalis longicornis TaxID=44386 RepID=A0A9J6G4I3_HAELO|nr:hypothetical protein HPB48_020403 [Haemaphysalis longicornis]